MILIGVTPDWNEEQKRLLLNQDYQNAVLHSGALPVILPLTNDKKMLDAAFDTADGLLFTGGADVDPTLYGEKKLPCCGSLCPMRDKMELYLMNRAIREKKPFLAICRGFEVMNIALGGSLYQDIAEQMSKELRHPVYEQPRTKVHDMQIVSGTRLHAVMGLDTFQVNSRHHQGVKKVADGLIVNAIASDGLIEGFELPEHQHPLALGVQWHPEALEDRYPEAAKLFTLLAEVCKQQKSASGVQV